MGGLMSRQKGQRGERDIIKLLQPTVDEVYSSMDLDAPRLQRNTLQSDGGGFDIVGLEWMALEVKRQEKNAVNAWWAQTIEQAGKDKEPVLVYRFNGERSWRVCLRGYLWDGERLSCHRVTIDESDFLAWFRRRLTLELLR